MSETEQAPASGGVDVGELLALATVEKFAAGGHWYEPGKRIIPPVDGPAALYIIACSPERIIALCAELTALRARVEALTTPDSFWLYEDPEQYFADEQDMCDDALCVGEVARVLCGRTLPSRWAAHVCIPATETSDADSEIQMFATEAEALAALTPSPTPTRTEP